MTEPTTVVDAAARVRGRRGRVVLHSGRDEDGLGRWSFVACDPVATIEASGRHVIERDATGTVTSERNTDPFTALEAFAGDGPNFFTFGGEKVKKLGPSPHPTVIGYLGYDLGRTIEALGPGPQRGNDVPDMWFGRYAAVWRHDATTDTATIIADTADARARLAHALIEPRPVGAPPRLGPLRSDMTDADYTVKIDRILEYIGAGDIYQVNLARRLVAGVLAPGDPLAVYVELLESSAAPYGGLIELPGATVVSGSPERFLSRAADSLRVETRPIKGTRRRMGDAAADEALSAELAADTKERAEHLMIVDLERNDLGKVARIGSVCVDELGYIVELPTLLHMVSRVSCELREGVTCADVLRATFPGGSITGAPKLRAMEIIDELEPARRGPYTGAIGYLGAGGAMDLAIAIRTLVITPAEARLHVGGGIVADSTAARELEETEEKASAWRACLARLAG